MRRKSVDSKRGRLAEIFGPVVVAFFDELTGQGNYWRRVTSTVQGSKFNVSTRLGAVRRNSGRSRTSVGLRTERVPKNPRAHNGRADTILY